MGRRGRRLTRAQKIQLGKLDYNPEQFRMLFDLEDHFVLYDKTTDQTVVISKSKEGKRQSC